MPVSVTKKEKMYMCICLCLGIIGAMTYYECHPLLIMALAILLVLLYLVGKEETYRTGTRRSTSVLVAAPRLWNGLPVSEDDMDLITTGVEMLDIQN